LNRVGYANAVRNFIALPIDASFGGGDYIKRLRNARGPHAALSSPRDEPKQARTT
jgi:hypothetical protein